MFWKERRKKQRQSLPMPASLRIKFVQQPAAVSNLSEGGCRLDISGLTLNPGNRVLITPNRFQSLLGTVRWVSEGRAGIEFDTPLEAALVDHFCRTYPDSNTAVILDIAA